MWGYDIEYAGELAEDHDIYIIERPDVPVPEIDIYKSPFREGMVICICQTKP